MLATSVTVALAASGFFGNPTGADAYWQAQTQPDCLEQSVRIAVDELHHKPVVTETAIDAYATSKGYYVPGVGTVSPQWTSLITHYGSTFTGPSGMSQARLETDLAKGYVVIVTLNSETIWNPLGYVTAHPSTGPDHAVVVEAVNAATGSVVLADTGIPTGENEVVPWSRFSQAWSASGWSAVVVS